MEFKEHKEEIEGFLYSLLIGVELPTFKNDEDVEQYLNEWGDDELDESKDLFLKVLKLSGSINVIETFIEIEGRCRHSLNTIVYFENFNTHIKCSDIGSEDEGFERSLSLVEPINQKLSYNYKFISNI